MNTKADLIIQLSFIKPYIKEVCKMSSMPCISYLYVLENMVVFICICMLFIFAYNVSLLLLFKELVSEYVNNFSILKSNIINIHNYNLHKQKNFGLPSKCHLLWRSASRQSEAIGNISFMMETFPTMFSGPPPRKVSSDFQDLTFRSPSLGRLYLLLIPHSNCSNPS